MDILIGVFVKAFGVSGAVFAVLAFTPLSVLPMIFLFPFSGMPGILLLLLITGAPFAGYCFALVFSPKGRRVRNLTELTGFWIGAICGSWIGLKLAGEV